MDSQEQEFIKVAEAMGWKRHVFDGHIRWISPDAKQWLDKLPNPLSDANADYAILMWIQSKPEWLYRVRDAMFQITRDNLRKNRIENYCLGDFFRVALKLLKWEEDRKRERSGQVSG